MPCRHCAEEVTEPAIKVPKDLVSAMADAALATMHELRQELEKQPGMEKHTQAAVALIHWMDELVEMVREFRAPAPS